MSRGFCKKGTAWNKGAVLEPISRHACHEILALFCFFILVLYSMFYIILYCMYIFYTIHCVIFQRYSYHLIRATSFFRWRTLRCASCDRGTWYRCRRKFQYLLQLISNSFPNHFEIILKSFSMLFTVKGAKCRSKSGATAEGY